MLFNYLLDNELLFWGLGACIGGAILIAFIIYLASRQTLKGAIDTTAKLVGIAAGSSVIHKNLNSSSE